MIDRIRLLPYWCITDIGPAFYDTSSATCIEQTGKVYSAMRELQIDYNKFVEEVNTCITEFINEVNTDQEEFENRINKIMHDYIMKIDSKIKMQDLTIANAVQYMKDNLRESLNSMLQEMKELGEFDDAVLKALTDITTSINEINTKTANNENNIESNRVNIETLRNDVTDLQQSKVKYIYDEIEKSLNLLYVENEVNE